MISEFLLNIVFRIVESALSLLPDWSFTINEESLNVFLSWIRVAGYLLPMNTILVLVGLVIWFGIFRITIAGVKTIWDVLPLV